MAGPAQTGLLLEIGAVFNSLVRPFRGARSVGVAGTVVATDAISNGRIVSRPLALAIIAITNTATACK